MDMLRQGNRWQLDCLSLGTPLQLKGATEKPMTGWGEHLQSYLAPSVHVDNRAVNGRSTKSFIAEGRLADIEKDIQAGDYLFIQFGHNDEKKKTPLAIPILMESIVKT